MMIRALKITLAVTINIVKWAAAMVIVLMLLCGCKTHTEAVPVEIRTEVTTHDTTERVSRIVLKDSSATHTETSTIIKDSIAPIFDSLGRLTGFDRYHYRENTRRTDTDTKQLMAVIDSLKQSKAKVEYREKPVPYPVVKEVERKKTWWEATLNALGWVMLAILGLFALSGLAYLYLKCRKKL